jgi:hypothetical protein
MRTVTESIDEPYSPAQAAGIALFSAVVAIGSGVVLWTWDGWSSWIAGPVFWLSLLGLLGAIPGWYDARHPNAPERRRVFALAFLAGFFALAGGLLAWVMFRPDSNCSDCDSASGWAIGIGFQVICWGMAGVSVRQIVKGRTASPN